MLRELTLDRGYCLVTCREIAAGEELYAYKGSKSYYAPKYRCGNRSRKAGEIAEFAPYIGEKLELLYAEPRPKRTRRDLTATFEAAAHNSDADDGIGPADIDDGDDSEDEDFLPDIDDDNNANDGEDEEEEEVEMESDDDDVDDLNGTD